MNNLNKIALDFTVLENTAAPALAGATIGTVVGKFFELIIPIAGFVMMFFLIWAGYQYMTSAGDPKLLQASKSNITYAVVGFIVVIGSYAIARLFGLSLNLPGIRSLFP